MTVTLVGGPHDGLVVKGDDHGHTIYTPVLKEMQAENWHPATYWADDESKSQTCERTDCTDMAHFLYRWAYVLRDGEYRYEDEAPA